MAKLDGKVALITGAAAGLGEGISTADAKPGSSCSSNGKDVCRRLLTNIP